MIKPMIIAVIPAKNSSAAMSLINQFFHDNGMNKISYFSTAVFSPSILITKPIAKV
jgi:hypothetical protein